MSKIKIVVVGNCQSRPIAQFLEAYGRDVKVTAIAVVHLLKSEQITEYEAAFDEADIIVAQLVSDTYPCEFVRTNFLKERYGDKVISIVNLYYKGYTPDWFYIRLPEAGTLRGPMGDYHNKTIYEAWLLGLDKAIAVQQLQDVKFNNKYLNELDDSLTTLKEREILVDVSITDYIERNIHKKRLFFTFNHPCRELLTEYVKRILDRVGIKTKLKLFDLRRTVLAEPLGQFVPVANPIINKNGKFTIDEHKGVETQFTHDNIKVGAKKTYTSEALVDRFYNVYDKYGEQYQLGSNKKEIGRVVITLGFNVDNDEVVTRKPIYSKQLISINLHALYTSFRNVGLPKLIKELENNLTAVSNYMDELDWAIIDNTPLYKDLCAAQCFDVYTDELDRYIQEAIVSFTKFFADKPAKQIKRIDKSLDPDELIVKQSANVEHWENKLYVRYGVVENRAIHNYLFRNKDLKPTIIELLKRYSEEDFIYSGRANPGNWLSYENTSYNIRQLCTNAGFYGGLDESSFLNDFNSWAEKYISALVNADYLFDFRVTYPNFLRIQAELEVNKTQPIEYKGFPEVQQFYRTLAERQVLFLSPFANQLNQLFESGDMFKLYKTIQIPNFNFKALPSFLSTYPNRPHSGWNETFEQMCHMVDEEMDICKHEIFFASCGAYGLPICEYVQKKHSIPAIYFGNRANTLFGVLQASTKNFMLDERNETMWRTSHLGSVEGMSKIDGGRYV